MAGDAQDLVGELVAADGTRYPLRPAVTLVGSGPDCDLKVAGLAPLHCVFTHTPAGAVLRSWHPESTQVDGKPTGQKLLTSGERVTLAGVHYQFIWHWADLVPLEHVPADVTLAELIEARHRQFAAMADDLGVMREQLRQAPRHLRHAKRESARLLRESRRDRAKAKSLARRFAARLRARHLAERETLIAGRAELSRDRAAFENQRAECVRRDAEMSGREARLAAGWASLAAEQEALHAEREAAVTLELAPVQPEGVRLSVASPDRRPVQLAHEVEALERRAGHAAAALERLEASRAQVEAALAPPAQNVWLDAVPLQADPLELMESLATQDRQLATDRSGLDRIRAELKRQTIDLNDLRLVVAEQLSQVVVARRDWHRAESLVFGELESIAHALQAREDSLDQREQRVQKLDAVRQARAQDLWKLRLKLEAWQGNLVAHEAAATAARGQLDAELTVKRGHLENWEASLGGLMRDWAELRRREVTRLNAELDAVERERARHRLTAADLDQERQQLHADLAATAAAAVATGEVQAQLAAGPKGTALARQVRVGQKRYERHFHGFRRELDARRERLAAETAAADARLKSLRRELEASQARDHELADKEAAGLAERQKLARELDERRATLEAELAKSATATAELQSVRAEVERLSGLLTQSAPTVTLRLAA